MKWLPRLALIFLAVLLAVTILWVTLPAANLSSPLVKAAMQFQTKPVNNWVICKDLGIGPVPGVSGQRQRLRLCHNKGWEINAYCVEPNKPAPAIGTVCTRRSETTYWCGNSVQMLSEYQQITTPTEVSTPTFTPTSSSTPTSTSTTTPLPTQTSTPVLPTLTPHPRATTPVVSPRPRPGGRSNLEFLLLILFVGGTAALFSGIRLIWVVKKP